MPVLVKHNEEVAPLKLENVMHHTMPELVKYNEEAASLKLDDEFSETNYELGTKSVTTASSASSSAQHAGSLPEEGHSQTELQELLTSEGACCKKWKDSRSSQTKTSTVKHHSTSNKLCVAGKYVCMLCCARTDSEEQFHENHHSVHHPNAEPKYCFQTVSYKAKPTKFKCKKCSFFSDNFEILKEHLQHHIKAFQMWLCAQQCDLESSVVRRCQFSHEDCDVGELEIEHLNKLVMQSNMDDTKSLCPEVPGPEKKDMKSIPHRIQNVAHKLTGLSSVSDRPIIKPLSANKPVQNCTESSENDDPSNESSHSYYGRSPSPIDENKLLVSVNCGGSGIRMSLSTFKKLCHIHPKVKVRDLKHEKFMPA
ncbi:uncharacterized protein LOC126291857 [Schistocerca gregaria]|uniref:uncharacterized protein LOC126291857 n=1 Tax=Schistocerca gregaria TaxID=7010 RepID=UPI00211F0A38|nr:uncharacterized protein LOC126291857 [Schistocerca gregaria]